jgi:hypothetical protein
MTAKTNNGKNKQRQNTQQQKQKQIPFGDDNQRDNSKTNNGKK